MKFINIKNAKLKVIITPEECIRYGIDTTKCDFTRSEIKGVVKDILALAQDECGFCVTSDKMLVQLYPMPSGECEIFVTKLTGLTIKESSAIVGEESLTTMQKKREIYRFDSREILTRAIGAINKGDVACDLYVDEYGKYYISIEEEFTDGISELEVLIEYGERLSDMPIYALCEYGRLLAKNKAIGSIIPECFE